MNLLNVFLMMGPQEGQASDGMGGFSTIIFMVALVAIFWLFFIRPQTKKAKEERLYRQSLTKGDKIITIGGVHGKIIEVDETTFVIETEGQGRLRIEKTAIAGGASSIAQK